MFEKVLLNPPSSEKEGFCEKKKKKNVLLENSRIFCGVGWSGEKLWKQLDLVPLCGHLLIQLLVITSLTLSF